MSERVWKIDEDGDLCLYVDGEPLYGTAWFLDKDAAAELAAILERGQAEPLPFTVTDAMNPDNIEVSVVGVVAGSFRVHRCGASDKAWNALLDALDLRVVDPEPEAKPTKDEAWEAYYVEHPESRPAPVSDDPLPEGVHWVGDGWACRAAVLPSLVGSWKRRRKVGVPGEPPQWDIIDEHTGSGVHPDELYEVRPVQPATERVPLVDAPTRKLPDGREIDVALPHDAFVAYTGPVVVVHADTDGLVEVLVEP